MFSEHAKLVEYAVVTIFLWVIMHGYFRLAARVGILDKPNLRSSHSKPTIRGGGIVIIVALVCWFLRYGFEYPWMVLGASMMAFISFADDVKPQSAALRFTVQSVVFALMLFPLSMYSPWWLLVIAGIVGVGAVNAFNFMDGINGITGVYAMVNLLTILYLNASFHFVQIELVVYVLLGVLVFLVFNFRKRARCFAGDVGSIVLAYTQIFLVLLLVVATGDYRWVLLFLIYGIDSVATIVYRIINRENIFKPHRTHLYQYLANEYHYTHLGVSSFYGLLQIAVNVILIVSFPEPAGLPVTLLIAGMTLLYLTVREILLKRIGREGVIYKLLKKSPHKS